MDGRRQAASLRSRLLGTCGFHGLQRGAPRPIRTADLHIRSHLTRLDGSMTYAERASLGCTGVAWSGGTARGSMRCILEPTRCARIVWGDLLLRLWPLLEVISWRDPSAGVSIDIASARKPVSEICALMRRWNRRDVEPPLCSIGTPATALTASKFPGLAAAAGTRRVARAAEAHLPYFA